jgi:hypothetical protein
MNYYQKYQKYKFKYLNLLNQSGGDQIPYTEEDFILLDKYLYDNSNLTNEELEILKKIIYLDDDNQKLLKDKHNEELLKDPISFDSIDIKNAVLIDNIVYDANSLFKSIISGHKKIPHNNKNFNFKNLVDIRNKLNNVNKKNVNVIKNLILSKFTGNVQNLLNQLEPEQLEIFFTKIKILNLDLNLVLDLDLDLVNYLLNNNTDNFINDLRTNYKLLILVPENKMTFEICMIAVKTNSLALKYISKNITDDEYYKLYEEAIKNNKNILNLVPKNKRTYKIYMLAITNNVHELEHVELNNNITREQYYELCEKAVEKNGRVIYYVKTKVIDENNHEPINMTSEQYYELCKKALTDDGCALEFVNKNIKDISYEQYYNLYDKAIYNCESVLKFIPLEIIYKNIDKYYYLCIKAVQINGLSINYIPSKIIILLGKDKYSTIYKLAIKQNKEIESSIMSFEYYENIMRYMQKRTNT